MPGYSSPTDAPSSPPALTRRTRIFYLCSDDSRPTGGEKHSYQHVDVLSRYGFDAYVLHRQPGLRLSWFDNDTPIAYWGDISFDAQHDYFVVPEVLGLKTSRVPGKKVVFNKNVYYGFNALGLSPLGPTKYFSPDVVAIISVSEHNKDHLTFAYPGVPVVVVTPDIRISHFAYQPTRENGLQIAYAAKGSMDGRTLFQMLSARALAGLNGLGTATWVQVFGLTEDEVAVTLQDALVLLFLSVHEGLARLPLEAMACGCIVCAYDTGGQRTYLPPEYRFACGDLLSIARRVEEVVSCYPHRLSEFDAIRAKARRIAERYSSAEQERTVLAAWESILSLTSGRH